MNCGERVEVDDVREVRVERMEFGRAREPNATLALSQKLRPHFRGVRVLPRDFSQLEQPKQTYRK
jgi:hypothetical protein